MNLHVTKALMFRNQDRLGKEKGKEAMLPNLYHSEILSYF